MHFGGYSVEGPWETILSANIIGARNIYEAAYRKGAKRVVFASSNHAVGFYPRSRKIGINVTVRPDSRYGVSKAFGEAMGALYADKHGLRVTCLRIGNFGEAPIDERRLSIWLKPEDLVQLDPHRSRAPRHQVRDFLRHVGQRRGVVGQLATPVKFGYKPIGKAEDYRAAAMEAQTKLAERPGRRLAAGRHLSERRIRRR